MASSMGYVLRPPCVPQRAHKSSTSTVWSPRLAQVGATKRARVFSVRASADGDLEKLRKASGFGRGKRFSDATDKVQLKEKLESARELEQANWADGGGFTGAWRVHYAEHREAFLHQLELSKEGKADVLDWAMQIAAEDDALATHSVVQLPVKAYLKRVDSMVNEFTVRDLPKVLEGFDVNVSDEKRALAIGRAVEEFLFSTRKYRITNKMMVVECAMYTPYRIYMQNVLTQVQGSPNSLAALLLAFLDRLAATGNLPAKLAVVVPNIGGAEGLPFCQLASDDTPLNTVSASAPELVKAMLQELKKGYWPWEWIPGSSNGFLEPARAAAGQEGRVGMTKIQGSFAPAMGRPFGDAEQAANAAERLALLDGDPLECRDFGILQWHRGNLQQALVLFQAYKDATAPLTGELALAALQPAAVPDEEEAILDGLIADLQKTAAESAFAAADTETPSK